MTILASRRRLVRGILGSLLLPAFLLAAAEPMRLTLAAPIEKWDEAVPLGNGLLGGLLWGQGNELRLSLDRGDLWDLRPHPIYARPEFNYATVVAHAQSGRTDALNKAFAQPSDFPTKLPGARLVVTLAPEFQARAFHLDLQRALGSVDLGSAQAECFFGGTSPAALLQLPDPAATFDLLPNSAVTKLGYTVATVTRAEGAVTLVQDAAEGFRYVIHAAARPAGNRLILALAITTNRDTADPIALARQQCTAALDRGYDAARADQIQRWEKFWAKSSVSLPDAALQQHYDLVQYFYGAASRRGAPPIPLQGLWTADAGVLPPWRGDYHHDLNTQLTYWAYLASGRFDQGLSFLDFMWDLKPRHETFAREFFGVKKGMIVPGVMALDGRAMGSWFPYTLSPTMGAWVAQSFYWHWRYAMDPRFLADRAYPYCTAIGDALAELLQPDPRTGHLKLPLSSSPEIHNNTQRAWLPPHSNFDHALLQWLFLANAEMATALGRGPEAERWRSLHGRLGPLAVSDAGVLLVAPGEALTASHRHHSQLMAIHPLGLLHPENGADDRRIVDATLADLDRLGTSAWTGYSFSWMAALRARVGRGDEALRFLSAYREHTTSRNGFHLNGVITGSKISNYRGRAFTLEGNFAAAQAVHEMLLQSRGGRLRLFPALPSAWREVSFRDLHAEGGLIVSAEVRDGRVTRARIRATVDQELRLADPFPDRHYEASLPLPRANGELRGRLRAGQIVELREGRTTELSATPVPQAPDATWLRERGRLIFHDAFDREEIGNGAQAIGNGWNSATADRVPHLKQADLDEGILKITSASKEAGHAAHIHHEAGFADGGAIVRFRFPGLNKGESLQLGFVDRETKGIHAGHLCYANLGPGGITLMDWKTGVMNLEIRQRRQPYLDRKEKLPADLDALLKTKQVTVPWKADTDWHELVLVTEGDEMRLCLDGKLVAAHRSPGSAHPMKRWFSLLVPATVWIDRVELWRVQ